MKERPILFSAPMIRALLAGTKTQTRRVVKPQYDAAAWSVRPAITPRHPQHSHDWWLPDATAPAAALPNCPYGQPGDRLWVRETHSIGPGPDVPLLPGEDYGALRWPHVTYEADGAVEQRNTRWEGAYGRQRPSIHMPRWASRILLEINEVRVERLQDISEADAIAEGIERHDDEGVTYYGPLGSGDARPDRAYRALWESINGPGSWGANPWVWVIAFRPADQEGRSDG